jgi:starch synthase
MSFENAKEAHRKGVQTRIFMPRYGLINERRHQLHEVIRLSGMNLVINDMDMPLIIKVASIPKERMQVYFIDNDEYFKRKALFTDEDDNLFKDNDERAIFFAKGVVETVKKTELGSRYYTCSRMDGLPFASIHQRVLQRRAFVCRE